jgi:hypothetical protein
MPKVSFTPHLQRFADCPDRRVEAATVREALDAAFALSPKLRGYVVDEHGALRKHIAVFVDGKPIEDRTGLRDAVGPESEVYVLQALSGG